ncbi:MAG: CoA ester lyase, partial [Nitratireductor sp.]
RGIPADYLAGADRTGPKLFVRMNALDTPFWEDDLAAVVKAKPDGIMVPKTKSGDCIKTVAFALTEHEQEAGIATGTTKLCCVATETAASLFTLGTYQGASPRLSMMTWGAEDLAADLGARSNKDDDGLYTGPYRLARTLTLLGAVAAGVDPVDSIYADFRDEAGLEADARAAARDGFTGKMAIHPAQVPVINRVFTPSEEDLAHAHAVIKAFEDAGDVGVVSLDGVMLDMPHLKQARRLVERASQSST